MNDFEAAIRAHGLLPRGPVVADGQWHRCPTENHPRKKNGAYKLAPDGRIGWYWDLAIDGGVITWRPEGSGAAAAPEPDWEALRKRRAEERERLRRATLEAREFYDRCAPLLGGHPYLEAHDLDMTGCLGLRVDADGWLVVPAMRGGRLLSVQRIAPDGTKRFWPGASMRGAQYPVHRPGASITVLCEGLATGLAIFAAAPLTRVVVAFTSGNLARVAETTEFRGMVAVAADNDHRTAERIGKNPGIVAAEEAAGILGCGVMVPTGITGSDWCDLRRERVAERVERRPYGSHETEGAIRRAVDAEIAMEVQRRAKFLMGKASA